MIRSFIPLSVKHKVMYISSNVRTTSQLADEWLSWQLVATSHWILLPQDPFHGTTPCTSTFPCTRYAPTAREDSIGPYANHNSKKNKNFFNGLHIFIYNFRKRFQLHMRPGWIQGPTNLNKNPYWTWILTSKQKTCPLRPENHRGKHKTKDENMHPTKSNLRFNTYTYNHPKSRVLNDSIRTCLITERTKYHQQNPEITEQ